MFYVILYYHAALQVRGAILSTSRYVRWLHSRPRSHTLPQYTTLSYTIPYYTGERSVSVDSTRVFKAILDHTALHYVLYHTIVHCNALHYTTLYSTSLSTACAQVREAMSVGSTRVVGAILCHTTLHYTTIVHHTTLHYNILYCITLHCTTLYTTTLHYPAGARGHVCWLYSRPRRSFREGARRLDAARASAVGRGLN